MKSTFQFMLAALLLAIFTGAASAQIRIGNITVPAPTTKKPQPTSSPNTTTPNPNGNRTPVTNNGNGTRTGNVETGATRDEVSQFNKDMAPYREGMYSLKHWAVATDPIRAGCGEVASLRRALTEGAAFLEIIKQKYPGIENPSWSQDRNAEHHKVGDFRRAAENREAIVKKCVNGLMETRLAAEIKGIESSIADFGEGYVLTRDFNDKAARHAKLTERYKENYAAVGLTMPDDSVFAAYDAAHDRLVALANENAAKWVFPPTFHDPLIEAKARGWLKAADAKATVVEIGMLHGEWQVNKLANGIPSGRYKRGYVMFRVPGFQNCLVNSFALEQNYLGGGRFNDEAITSGMAHALRVQLCK